jgi:hypothetical protein
MAEQTQEVHTKTVHKSDEVALYGEKQFTDIGMSNLVMLRNDIQKLALSYGWQQNFSAQNDSAVQEIAIQNKFVPEYIADDLNTSARSATSKGINRSLSATLERPTKRIEEMLLNKFMQVVGASVEPHRQVISDSMHLITANCLHRARFGRNVKM